MMKILRQINTSAAIIVLVCFFLPWVQVSCAGIRDTMSGLDLARDGHGLLWFVPVLMGALILSAIGRIRREQNKVFARTATILAPSSVRFRSVFAHVPVNETLIRALASRMAAFW